MNRYDIVIVGAGVAGLGVASQLKDSGLNVAILDKKGSLDMQDTRLKATFGSTIKSFRLQPAVLRRYKTAYIYGPKSRASFDLEKDPAYLVDYVKILKILRKRSGLRVDFNVEIIDAKTTKKGIILRSTNNETYFAKLVVDASGRASSVAQMMGIERSKSYSLFYGFELENCSIDPSEGIFFVDRRFTTAGGWVYPISRSRCQVALGEFLPLAEVTVPDLRRSLLRFIRKYKPYSLKKSKAVKGTAFSVKYPISPIRTMVKNRLIVIGDSAGHATPIMAEGIRPILSISAVAAKTIEECFRKNNFSRKSLVPYEVAWWGIFGRKYCLGIVLRHVATNYFDNRQWDTALKKLDKLDIDTKYAFLKSDFGLLMLRKIVSPLDFLNISAIFLKEKWKKIWPISRRHMVSDFV